jgi:hypothetical protein
MLYKRRESSGAPTLQQSVKYVATEGGGGSIPGVQLAGGERGVKVFVDG